MSTDLSMSESNNSREALSETSLYDSTIEYLWSIFRALEHEASDGRNICSMCSDPRFREPLGAGILPWKVAGEGSGASDDRTRNKRRYGGGPDNTGRSVKRVRQAEGIEELDISMMQALAADNPYITTKVPVPRLDISTMMQGHATCNLDITTMMHHAPALGVDISTMMQQALVSGQLDISMEMQLAQNFGVNAENGGHVACADVREPETFSGIATDAATP
ncbi:hypothetical protein DL95DRAFT_472010 [Leptodontidium sp. 2 PMI_412]|nr:hypothetical protein DL95DRAFT_472010 [Leptodontidium sp. 2 PMI_412]